MATSLMRCARAVAARLLPWTRPLPVDGRLLTLAEVRAVGVQGYDIVLHRHSASKRYEKYVFRACRRGRTVGRLDVDFIAPRRWLYVANIHVVEAHGNRGVGTALLVCAAKTTACTVLTTSARTRQGARFFARNRAVMKSYGVEMSDRPPAASTLAPFPLERAPASPSAAR